jgi:hypothetical protein
MTVVCSALLVKSQVTARTVPRGRRASRGAMSCCHGDSRGRRARCAQHRGGPTRPDGRRPGRSGRETRVGAAVALAERIDGVDLCVVMRQALYELLEAQAVETVFACEVREQPRQVGADVLRQGEQVARNVSRVRRRDYARAGTSSSPRGSPALIRRAASSSCASVSSPRPQRPSSASATPGSRPSARTDASAFSAAWARVVILSFYRCGASWQLSAGSAGIRGRIGSSTDSNVGR